MGLLAFLAVNPAQCSAVTSDECVDRLLRLLRAFPDQPSILERTLTALFVTPGVPGLLVSKGAVPLAIVAMKDHHSSPAVRGCDGCVGHACYVAFVCATVRAWCVGRVFYVAFVCALVRGVWDVFVTWLSCVLLCALLVGRGALVRPCARALLVCVASDCVPA